HVFLQGPVHVVADDASLHHAALAVPGYVVRGAEGGDLDDLLAEAHVREAEAPADELAVAEYLAHLFRVRVRGDVEILRLASEHEVAHAAPHQERPVPGVLQAVEHLQRVLADGLPGDGVFAARQDARPGPQVADIGCLFHLRFRAMRRVLSVAYDIIGRLRSRAPFV